MTADPCCHPREHELEDELSIAEGARAAGEWKHALHHYVGALGKDAFSEQALAAIRRLHAERGLLATLEEDGFIGAHLARAYLLADAGDYEEAVSIVAQVDQAVPHLGAVRLLTQWFDVKPLSEDALMWAARRLAGAGQVGMGRVRLLPGERAAVAPYAELAAKVVVRECPPPVLGAASGIFRRAGQIDEAVRTAEMAGPDETSLLVPLALAHRAGGRPEEASELFGRVFEATNEPIYLLERARALSDAKLWKAALDTANRWLRLSKKEPDREASIFIDWVTACLKGDVAARARDYDWVRRSALLHDAILVMNDASTNILSDSRVPRGGKVKVGVSALEAPSVRMCLAVHQGSGPDPRAVEYTYNAVPSPDPRLPRGTVKTLLWKEEDGVMVQAVRPPSDAVQALVAEVTKDAGDLFEAWDLAARLAPRAAERTSELAQAMVFPTSPPDDFPTASWVYRTQVAAACLIVHASGGWRGSERRQVLLDLLRGPVDWTTSAAILVLGELAVREPDALAEIRRELTTLGKAIPQGGHCCFGATLAVTAQKIPFFQPDLAEKLTEDWLRGGEPTPTPTPTPTPNPTPTSDAAKRPWWKLW